MFSHHLGGGKRDRRPEGENVWSKKRQTEGCRGSDKNAGRTKKVHSVLEKGCLLVCPT